MYTIDYILISPRDIPEFYKYDYLKSTLDILSNLEEIDNISFCEGGEEFIYKVPKIPGVYFICTEKQFLYIGWSKNICNRLCQHKEPKRKYILCESVTIYWTECDYPELEYFLIRKLKPILNRVKK